MQYSELPKCPPSGQIFSQERLEPGYRATCDIRPATINRGKSPARCRSSCGRARSEELGTFVWRNSPLKGEHSLRFFGSPLEGSAVHTKIDGPKEFPVPGNRLSDRHTNRIEISAIKRP